MKLRIGSALAAITHLAAYGVFGWVVFWSLTTLAGLAVGLLPVFGIGLLFLALLALCLRAIWLLESWRVSTLFDIDVRQVPMRRSTRTDWLRIPNTLLLQFADGNNWLAVLHGFIMTLLGSIALGVVTGIGWAIGMLFWPITYAGVEAPWVGPIAPTSPWIVVLGVVFIALGLAVLYGLAVVHRVISVPMFSPDRERELREQAQASERRQGEAIRAADVERSRIERDLHDGVQPRLVSVGMTLGRARQKIATDPEAATALLDEAHTSTKAAITELRQLARGFQPAVLEDRGLDAALSALAAGTHLPVQLDVRVGGRCSRAAESAMYFAIAESLTNATKHARAQGCRVTVLERPGGMLWARIEDDGVGGAKQLPGGGIDGVANRVRAAGGTYSLSSPLGGPTTIEVSLPCAS
ncbi:hypothetical protein F8O01_09125 [Pseudoclavibacter chungangensis]|uniref:histidine kinase n=1 Tax=Pseudoclavibacter chungangensis TaxID=587635 RepID=A0A7J5BR90_9MICO|nr:histidine kinase [Pseudoclavibacter chungangensis]KAB1656811.1 hypothetical protein F8O01_09125 [Pseudoclavibacter chungangensis]NYJ67261.1 signal transduction histidine kinase [Pseudoclavibacter chungangensis]